MDTPPITTRRTFLGSLIAAVPAAGALAGLMGVDPIIAEAIVWHHVNGEIFRSRLHRSGKQTAQFGGRTLVPDADGMFTCDEDRLFVSAKGRWERGEFTCTYLRVGWRVSGTATKLVVT